MNIKKMRNSLNEKKELLKLQIEYRKGNIKVENIPEEQLQKLIELYKIQINYLKKSIENDRKKITNIRRKLTKS